MSDLANKEAIRLNLNFLMHSNIFVFSIGNVSCTIGDVFISNLRVIPTIWQQGLLRTWGHKTQSKDKGYIHTSSRSVSKKSCSKTKDRFKVRDEG